MLSINDIFITLILTVFPLTTKMSCHVIHHETCLNKDINMLLSCFEFFCLKYLWSEVCLFVRTLLPQSGKFMECLSLPVPLVLLNEIKLPDNHIGSFNSLLHKFNVVNHLKS